MMILDVTYFVCDEKKHFCYFYAEYAVQTNHSNNLLA